MGSRGALVTAAVATAGLVVGGVWGGLALAGPSHQAPPAHVVDAPAYSDDAVTTTSAPTAPGIAPTTTTTAAPQPEPAIGAPAGCRYTNTCASTTTAPVSP